VSRKEIPAIDDDLLVSAVGAVIFASDGPVPVKEIAELFGELEESAVEELVGRLAESHRQSESGLQVEKVAGGYRLATRAEVGGVVRQFMRQRNRARLSAAALETLAIVAYRQPVTVPEIQAIRGKDPTAALKNLLEKKLVRILGKKKVVGSPLLYGTSKQFLIHFGLDRLDDLPSIEEFEGFVDALQGGSADLLAGESEEVAEQELVDVEEGSAAPAGAERSHPAQAEEGRAAD
jgi:segregation and condensation protein B